MSPTIGRLALRFLLILGRVNVNVDNRAVLAEFLDLAGHAVVKAHAERQQQIRAVLIFDHRVGRIFGALNSPLTAQFA